jgi:hypothetical protein
MLDGGCTEADGHLGAIAGTGELVVRHARRCVDDLHSSM